LKALILAGGYGKRLRPITENKPKVLVEIAEKPILEWQIEWLKTFGFKDIVICIGYLGEKIKNLISNGEKFGVNIEYSIERSALGTGGAIKNAEPLLASEDRFIVVNGDIITNLNPKLLSKACKNVIGVIALVPLRSPYGIVDVDSSNLIKKFVEKPVIPGFWINAGVYCLSNEIFDYLPEKGNIEFETFPRLAEERKLRAVKFSDVFWKAIDTYKDLEEADRILRSEKLRFSF